MKQPSAHNLHKEQVVQDHLISRLVAGEKYLLRDAKGDYDRALAMDRSLVLRFVQSSQPDELGQAGRALFGSGGGHVLQPVREIAEGSRIAGRAAAGRQNCPRHQVCPLLLSSCQQLGTQAGRRV